MKHFFLQLLMISQLLAQAAIYTPAEQTILDLYDYTKKRSAADIEQVIAPHKDEVLAILRNAEMGKTEFKGGNIAPSFARRILLKLNDQETLARVGNYFSIINSRYLGDLGEDVMASQQPSIIPYLSYILFMTDSILGDRVKGDVVVDFDRAGVGCYVIVDLVRNSDLFNPETKEWARSIASTDKFDERRLILRKWWNANKELLQAGKFGEVQPGESLGNPTPAPTLPQVEETPIPAKPLAPLPSPKPSPLATAPETKSPASALALGILLLAATGGFIVYRRRK